MFRSQQVIVCVDSPATTPSTTELKEGNLNFKKIVQVSAVTCRDTNAREQPSSTWYSGTRGIDDDVYILATDADTEFSGSSVRVLLDLCNADRSLGAACGRTVPVGGWKPIVWYQKFEYAKGKRMRTLYMTSF